MRVSQRWLEEYVELPTNDPDKIATALAALGHEVEAVQRLEADWSDVVVGRVEAVDAHPDAEKIRVCAVDVGGQTLEIICGAWNFEAGAMVPVALPGATLAGGFEIGERTIRGVKSSGMICSERELGLGDDHEGIMVLEGSATIGTSLAEMVELPDVVFDIAITPNRPDVMSMVGVARELAAHFGSSYHTPQAPEPPLGSGEPVLSITVDDTVGCRRFTAREIHGVANAAAPFWLRHRLRKAGIRAISSTVDVTNYVMVESGQPLHAFDVDAISGATLTIRRARWGEALTTLDGITRDLTADDLVIADGDGPTSLAGTMGGARSEVHAGTTRVLMEAANWDPPTILHMSKRHELRSEASARFERGVDPEAAEWANRRATSLLTELAGGEVVGAVDLVSRPVERAVITVTSRDVEQLLGDEVDLTEAARLLRSIELDVEEEDALTVTVPTFRPDVTRPADVVEEIARLHGYDRFGLSVAVGHGGGLTHEQRRRRLLKEILVGVGLSEAVVLPFIGKDEVEAFGYGASDLVVVRNPLRDEESLLRPTLLPGLLRAARRNVGYGRMSGALFETGLVFRSQPWAGDPRLPDQPELVAWVVWGGLDGGALDEPERPSGARLSKAIWTAVAAGLLIDDAAEVEAAPPGFHPTRTIAVSIAGDVIGHVGELHPSLARRYEAPGRLAVAELELPRLLERRPLAVVATPSPYPHFDFDLALVVDERVPAADLIEATTGAAGGLVEEVSVFDEFRGEAIGDGRKSVAIRFRLRAPDRTLTNEEVAPIRRDMIAAAESRGATLRGG